MNKLATIQTRENLNDVYSDGDIGPGRAYHEYNVYRAGDDVNGDGEPLIVIQFQMGPRKLENSQHGVIDADLLEIVRDRLKAFQSGPFACRENACALTHIEEALMWMNRRVEDRIARNVLGTYGK